ncbi:uncharacterized protein LOC133852376 [Alnus glutinosa]|uniref:uncharacterized protein LOC133852376 n=1 Tax=Alnus glutinosa TaxID=3517 RepID=UPI002D78F3D6|nr:uncharacterized protein LOC133852376 [Alnus glutinosa]
MQKLVVHGEKVPCGFPSLEELRIAYMVNLKITWHNNFTVDSFFNPKAMKVEFCENLIVQETFAITATQLKELHLLHLPKLKHIWNKDPQEILSFQNPLEVHAMGCESLETPLPGAEEDFPESQKVEFDDHGRVKEIVLRFQNSSVFPQESILQIGRC